MKELLTIIIPTYATRNRFLNRLLNYMTSIKFDYYIIIADSSQPENLQKNIHLVKNLSSQLDIDHDIYDKEIGGYQKTALAAQKVNTPYAVFAADDDFPIPNALNKAVYFLEKNQDYSTVQGVGTLFGIESGLYYGKIKSINCEHLKTIEHDSPSQRLLEHLKNYSPTWYSVHRTSDLKDNLKRNSELNLEFRFGELFPSCLSIIQGKCKKIPSLYMVRQVHSERSTNFHPTYQLHDWIADNNWSLHYSRFRQYIAEELAKYENITIESAMNTVKQAVFHYIITASTTHSMFTDELISINKLLHPSHPFYTDFLPVHRAIDPFSDRIEWESSFFIQELEKIIQKYKSFPQNYYMIVSLRKLRKILANKLLNTIPKKIPEIFETSFMEKSYQLLLNSGLKNEPLTKDEDVFLQQSLKNDKGISDTLESLKNRLISSLFV